MPPVGFEPTIAAGERQKTYALERAATGTGNVANIVKQNDKGKMNDDNLKSTVLNKTVPKN